MATTTTYPNCRCCQPPAPACGNCPVFPAQWYFTITQVCQPVFATATCAPEPNPCAQTFRRPWVLNYDPTYRQTCNPTSTTTCWFRSEAISYRPADSNLFLTLRWYMTFMPPPYPDPQSSAVTAILDLLLTGQNGSDVTCPPLTGTYLRLLHRGPLDCMGCNRFVMTAATTNHSLACNFWSTYSGLVEFNVCPLLN